MVLKCKIASFLVVFITCCFPNYSNNDVFGNTQQCPSNSDQARNTNLKPKQPKIYIEQSKITFCEVIPCNPDHKNVCIDKKVEPGQTVVIFSNGPKPLCQAKISKPQEIYTETSIWIGTELEDVDCELPESSYFGVLNEEFTELERFDFEKITDTTITAFYHQRFAETKILDKVLHMNEDDERLYKFIEESFRNPPKLFKYPHPDWNIYFADYYWAIIVMNSDDYFLLPEIIEKRLCLKLTKAFRLDNRYFFEVTACRCGTCSCSRVYYELSERSL